MKQKRSIYGVFEIIVLAVISLVAFTVLNKEYLFEWAAHNWKFYFILVGIVLFLIFLNKQVVSAFMTMGIAVGIFIGNYLGKLIKGLNEAKIVEGMNAEIAYRLRHNPGFEIWIGIILLSIVIGIVMQIISTRKRIK